MKQRSAHTKTENYSSLGVNEFTAKHNGCSHSAEEQVPYINHVWYDVCAARILFLGCLSIVPMMTATHHLLWTCQWFMNQICAWNVQWHFGRCVCSTMSGEWKGRSFRCCHFCLAWDIWSASTHDVPLRIEAHHKLLSLPTVSHVSVLRLQFFRLYLSPSLNLFFQSHWFRCPFTSSQ